MAAKPKQPNGQAVGETQAASAHRLKPSSFIDTRVIYCGDNLEQLKNSSTSFTLERTPISRKLLSSFLCIAIALLLNQSCVASLVICIYHNNAIYVAADSLCA
jgi:hypothetical protein